MTSGIYFTATSWFPENVRVKPHSKHSGGGAYDPSPQKRRDLPENWQIQPLCNVIRKENRNRNRQWNVFYLCSPNFFSTFHRLWYVNLSGGFKKGHLINSGLMVFWVGWHADGTIGLIPFWRSLFVFTPLYLSVIPWFLYDCTLNLVKKQAHKMFFCY